jgi:hypothetical protein
MRFRAKCRYSGGFMLLLLAPRGALAESSPVAVDCPTWSRDSVAQIETRVRTTLLSEPEGTRVQISCRAGSARVVVHGPQGNREVPIVALGGSGEDDVLAALELALSGPEAPSPAEAPSPVAAAAPVAVEAPVPSAAPLVRQPTVPAAPLLVSKRVVDIGARLMLENWSGVWAEGVEAGLSVGDPWLTYGLAMGGRVAVSEPVGFELSEWSAAMHARFTVPRAGGFVVNVGLGVSLFAVTPGANLRSTSSTLVGAAFAEASFSRPFHVGRFWLAPALGARFFGGERRVRVNEIERATLPVATPQASLSLVYRMD